MGEDKPLCGECGFKESSPRHGPIAECSSEGGCVAPEEHHPYLDHHHLLDPKTVHVYVGAEAADSPRGFIGARGFCYYCDKRFDYMLFSGGALAMAGLRVVKDA